MSDSAANDILKKGPTREIQGKSARIAALFSLLGTDCRQNIHTILLQARDIFGAERCIYLDLASGEPVAPGGPLSVEAIHRLTSWAQDLSTLPDEADVLLFGRESLPPDIGWDCCTLVCIPVTTDGTRLGMLVAGFKTDRELGPDDRHAARCLSGALGL